MPPLLSIEGLDVRYDSPRIGDVRDSLADTTLAVKLLGHNPQFSLEEGLRRTLEWYKANGR